MRFFFVFCLLAASARGDVSFRRVAHPDDVPADLCTTLAQDRAGFLWIGTQSGLLRFDGQHFRVFPPMPGASYVRTILAARDGRVWAGTFAGGVVVYDPVTDAFTQIVRGLAHPRVEGLAEDASGKIWVATQGGLDRIDPRTRRVEHFRVAEERVRGLLIDRAGRLWVGSRDGLQILRGNAFERVAPGLAGKNVSKLYEDDRGRIWIGTADHGAYLFEPRTGDLRPIGGVSHFWIYAFAQVGPREMWVATFGKGIDVVDPETLAVTDRLRHDPTLPQTIGSDRIGALLRDRSGVVWVGTWGLGITRHDPASRAFRTIRHNPFRPNGLSHAAAVRALQMRDGTIWVGTNGNGVDVLDANLRRLRTVLPGTFITCLAQSSDDAIWIATLADDLYRLRGERLERFTKADGLPGGAIRTIAFGPRGEAWVGAAEGMARVEPPKIVAYRHVHDDPTTLSGHAVEAIAFGPDGTMWVGTDTGLNVFDPRRGVATRITRGLPNPWVPDLMFDHRGRLWVATHEGACILESWDGRKAVFTRVAARLGRPAAPVEALIEDDQGQVWLGPRLRVDPRTWSAREFGPADGCELRNFYIASRSKTKDGSLLFGGPEGLMIVQPRALVEWTYAPPVVSTSLRVDGAERPLPRTLIIAPGERGFRLDFAALDFTAPERNAYRYRLEPYDRDWIATDAAARSLTYTNLAPGNYMLRVQATNRGGRWSEHELRLPIRVLPTFYQMPWFWAVVALAALLLAYAIYRLRVRRLEARGRRLEQLVHERTAELESAYARIEEASLTDPLTQLRNRRFLEQVISADVEMAARRNADLVFLMLDLDHFKSVNDAHGHAAGDAVLFQTAAILRSTFRSSDYLVRWGGEEFLVVVRFVDRRDSADLAEKLRAAIEAHQFTLPDGSILRRTGSIGVAAFPCGDRTWEQCVALADEALYEAKGSGRNRVTLSAT